MGSSISRGGGPSGSPESADPRGSPPPAEWAKSAERGSRFWLAFVVFCIRRLGTAPMRILLPVIALYFCAFAPKARQASREFFAQLDRFEGRPPRKHNMRVFFRHIYSFAEVLLDRFALWGGRADRFEVELHGREVMEPYVAAQQGAMLIGAHLGSFDVLRLIAENAGIPVNVIMYTGNAQMVNAAFEELDPACNVRVIELDPHSANTVFAVRSCIARGEFVAILGDRAQLGGRTPRVGYASFLGRRAPFPQGPLLIAQVLRLPVILTLAIRTGPYRYDAYLESISTGELVSAADRPAAIEAQIERFAALLERFCVRAPNQWFNFYNFWDGLEGVGALDGGSDGGPGGETRERRHGSEA